jgi:hypothetical protein
VCSHACPALSACEQESLLMDRSELGARVAAPSDRAPLVAAASWAAAAEAVNGGEEGDCARVMARSGYVLGRTILIAERWYEGGEKRTRYVVYPGEGSAIWYRVLLSVERIGTNHICMHSVRGSS